MNGDWFPTDIDSQVAWYKDFIANNPVIVKDLAIPEQQVAPVVAFVSACLEKRTVVDEFRTKLAGAVKGYDDSVAAINEPLRVLVRQVKASPLATPEILALLGMTPGTSTVLRHVDAEKPVLKLLQGPGRIEISFMKHGRGGVCLYSKRGAETAFSQVGTFTTSPALDRRPNLLHGQAEHREYYAWYVEHDEPVGAQSDTATIAAAPTPG